MSCTAVTRRTGHLRLAARARWLDTSVLSSNLQNVCRAQRRRLTKRVAHVDGLDQSLDAVLHEKLPTVARCVASTGASRARRPQLDTRTRRCRGLRLFGSRNHRFGSVDLLSVHAVDGGFQDERCHGYLHRGGDRFGYYWLDDFHDRRAEITLARQRGALLERYALGALSGGLAFDSGQRHKRCVAALVLQACGDNGGHHCRAALILPGDLQIVAPFFSANSALGVPARAIWRSGPLRATTAGNMTPRS